MDVSSEPVAVARDGTDGWPAMLVHLDLGSPNAALLGTVRMLAERFGAAIVGIAACEPMQIDYSGGYVPGELIEQDFRDLADAMKAAEAAFRSAMQGHEAAVEWRARTEFATLATYVCDQARCADLVVMTTSSDGVFGSRRVSAGDLIMGCGRPVLVLPLKATARRLDRVVVAWKDTREARRAIADALPLLRVATHVDLVELAGAAEQDVSRARLADVAAWLSRHRVVADTTVVHARGDDAAQLLGLAHEQDADVIVAGAYGHSRFQEWALGGVTRDLLRQPDLCVLLSH